ncbi:agmatine/peptidylarginine deiminase [Streptomyces sp. NPDC056169]|uniref:agmatine deiminase family protein n=1 Tax=Streptomyces sp. NPDC056169 TaxID=3345734 RepID=UPI0035DE467F
MTNTPAAEGFSMPAEWVEHERTWMAWPTSNATFDGPDHDLHHARVAWGKVAETIARYEPVTMIANVGEADSIAPYVDRPLTVVERPLDDAWIRDSGPTFLTDGAGNLAAADWIFNGWGAQDWATWERDQHTAEQVIDLSGAKRYASRMVNEGGGIHVDGEGTVMITETVQLDKGRNPGWTKDEVEAELRAYLGIEKVIWLPRGLTRDYDVNGTRGHVDIIASFARPGVVLCHTQPDPAHPDHEVGKENLKLLRAATDARGRALEVVEIPAPTVLEDDGHGWVDYSYINHYVANGAVVLCGFDDPRDEENAATFAKLFPGRKIELVDAREIFANGGGIHCITQQQPRV